MNGLTNQQLVYLYFNFKIHVGRIEEVIKTRTLARPVSTPLGMMTLLQPIDDSAVAELEQEPQYLLIKSILETLEPIAEFILAAGEDFSDIEKMFQDNPDYKKYIQS
jgi:hypothetical protein